MYEEQINTLRNQLELDMDDIMRIEKLNLLRYYLSKDEDENKITKVEYVEEKDNLKYFLAKQASRIFDPVVANITTAAY